ncbi:MAG: hypothetical protein Q8P41_25605 [Pseudomonadota bacterium]|nr:hypothetical protein [Pseudomonadota bacterium]
MFGPDHYVPILKVKTAEKAAMYKLPASVAARVTPLLEIVVRKEVPESRTKPAYLPSVDEHLDKAFKGLRKAVNSFNRYFLDCREIAADGHQAAVSVFESASRLGTPFIPVTSISRNADVAAALAHRTHGIAMRLSREEFESGTLPTAVPSFLKKHGLNACDVDLIIDLGAVDQMIASGIAERTEEFLAEVPDHASWRTFTLSACDFPGTLKMDAGDEDDPVREASFARHQWTHWCTARRANGAFLARTPTFSDCGIQHRSGVEGVTRKISPAAAIRHSSADSWHIAKGKRIRGNPPQFPGLARKIIDATSAAGAHCPGCAGLHKAAANHEGFGNLMKWRELGTIHHITVTVESLAALRWP